MTEALRLVINHLFTKEPKIKKEATPIEVSTLLTTLNFYTEVDLYI